MEIDEDGSLLDSKETGGQQIWNLRELLVFLIDCTQEMFNNDFFQICLQSCKTALLNKVIGRSKDLVSIVFFGVEKKDPGDQNLKNVFTFCSPQLPNADIVKRINALLEMKPSEFSSTYGHSQGVSIADVLWHCSSIITKCPIKVNISTILLMTCNDNPHKDALVQQYQTRKRALDLAASGIKLQLLHLGNAFNVDAFYKQILEIVNADDNLVPFAHPAKKVDELLNRINRRYYKKRAVGKLDFHLGNGVCIKVEVYNFYRRLSIPPVTKLNRVTNDKLKSTYQAFNSETGEQMLESDLEKYHVVGNTRIRFTKNEIVKVTNIGETGLTLFGFKSMSYLSPEIYLRPSSFIYPTNHSIEHKMLFMELLEQCIVKSKFALACIIARYKGNPFYVALVPQKEQLGDNGLQILPSGFHVIYLPYAEHIRELNLDPLCEISDTQQNIFEQIIKKLTIKYQTSTFENPKIQTHWANIEALALNYSETREVCDDTQHDYDALSKRLGDLEKDFEDYFSCEIENNYSNKSVKRNWSQNNDNAKRACDVAYIEEMAHSRKLHRLTVDILKNYIECKGIFVPKQRKNDMVDNIYKYLNIPNF